MVHHPMQTWRPHLKYYTHSYTRSGNKRLEDARRQKKGHLVELPKKGVLSPYNNWRGIMLLSIPGKVLKNSF
jgi:hypothetical protein